VIKRLLLDKLAPLKTVQPNDTGYRRLLRWAALPVTDRRWAAPLAAVALGFGLFAGIAIGPGAAGTFAGGVPQIIEIPALVANGAGGGGGEEEAEEPVIAAAPSSDGREVAAEEEALSPVVTEPGFEVPAGEAEAPAASGPAPEEEEAREAEKEELAGTVAHVNPTAGSYTVVESGGVMSAVHAGKLPKVGTQVKIPIETLANGTLAEAGKRIKTGKRARATLAGIVTSVDAMSSEPSYAVSNRGTSALVHVHPDPSGAPVALPALGAYTSVAVQIETRPLPAASSSRAAVGALASAVGEPLASEPEAEPPPPEEPEPPAETTPTEPPPPAAAPAPIVAAPACAPDPAHPPVKAEPSSLLWQRQASGDGAPFTHSDFAGTVTAICPTTSQLMLSADDIRESGRDLLFTVPAGIDPSKLGVGDSILASADIAADGTLTLKGLASDEHRKGADDLEATQGDLVPARKPKN
jgi:hypothetical protein